MSSPKSAPAPTTTASAEGKYKRKKGYGMAEHMSDDEMERAEKEARDEAKMMGWKINEDPATVLTTGPTDPKKKKTPAERRKAVQPEYNDWQNYYGPGTGR